VSPNKIAKERKEVSKFSNGGEKGERDSSSARFEGYDRYRGQVANERARRLAVDKDPVLATKTISLQF